MKPWFDPYYSRRNARWLLTPYTLRGFPPEGEEAIVPSPSGEGWGEGEAVHMLLSI